MKVFNQYPYIYGRPVDYIDQDGDINIYVGRQNGYDHWMIVKY